MRIIDLSHKVYTGMPSIPSDKHVKTDIREISNIAKDGIERHQILMSCHSGTHMDAQIHMIEGGATIGSIPPDNFFGTAVKIDAPHGELEEIIPDDIKSASSKGFLLAWFEPGAVPGLDTHDVPRKIAKSPCKATV